MFFSHAPHSLARLLSVYRIQVEVTNAESLQQKFGRLTVVDLAAADSGLRGTSGVDVSREVLRVRKSLLSLQEVLLAITNKNSHIPHRNSFLTTTLRDALGTLSSPL